MKAEKTSGRIEPRVGSGVSIVRYIYGGIMLFHESEIRATILGKGDDLFWTS